jgi:hypothetical protein
MDHPVALQNADRSANNTIKPPDLDAPAVDMLLELEDRPGLDDRIVGPAWLVGNAETTRLTRPKDWSETSLGPIEFWPESLRTAVSLVLASDYRECWASAWPAIGGAFDAACAGRSASLENQPMFLDRHGYLEEPGSRSPSVRSALSTAMSQAAVGF